MYVTLMEASQFTGLSTGTLRKDCREGRIPGAVKYHGMWLVPKSASSALANIGGGRVGRPTVAERNARRTAAGRMMIAPMEGFVDAKEAAYRLGVSCRYVHFLLKKGRFASAFFSNRRWLIPEGSVLRVNRKFTRKPPRDPATI